MLIVTGLPGQLKRGSPVVPPDGNSGHALTTVRLAGSSRKSLAPAEPLPFSCSWRNADHPTRAPDLSYTRKVTVLDDVPDVLVVPTVRRGIGVTAAEDVCGKAS